MKNILSFQRVGQDDGQLLETDKSYIETNIIDTLEAALVARNVFPVQTLPSIGIKEWTVYNLTGMSNAVIDMDGLNNSKDRTVKVPHTVKVPMIHKGFQVTRRDLAASRRSGQGVDLTDALEASRRVAADEDRLLLSGETNGWKAFGIEGLCNATGRNTQASTGAWTTATNIVADVSAGIAELRKDKHFKALDMIVTSAMDELLRGVMANTTTTAYEMITKPGWVRNIFVSDNIYPTDDTQDSALIVEPDAQNFVLGVAPETVEPQVSVLQTGHHVWDYDIYEVATPHIKRPTSICEITGIAGL
jgi:uncharacterized linocin/CFP29 family protein